MKQRLLFLLKTYGALVLAFVVMKPVFMLYNGASVSYGFADVVSVIVHGLSMDLATAGYLIALPLFATLATVWLPSRKWWRKAMLAYFAFVALGLAIILAVDTVLYSFWQFKLDATIFAYLDRPENVTSSVSAGFLIVGVLAILVLAAAIFWLLRLCVPRSLGKCSRRPLATLVIVLMGGVTFLFIRGGTGKSTMNVGAAYYCDNQFFNHAAVNPAFSLFSSMLKAQDFDKMYRFYPRASDKEIYAELGYNTESTADVPLLRTRRPNIVLIIIEGFAGTFVEPLGGARGVTPQFNALTREGVFFTNFYANSFRTDRGTLSILSGYPAFPKTSPMKIPQKSRRLGGLAQSLAAAGYATDLLYGGDINFTNMKSYFLSTGYQTVWGETHFPESVRKTHAWGVTDRITCDTLRDMILRKPAGRPWFTTFLTLASHEPWQVPYHRKGLDKKANSMAYIDDCLGRLVRQLKATPAWDNMLLILLPDHGINYPEGTTEAMLKRYHIPMLWLGGAVKEPQRFTPICAQSDLLATLLGQLGIDHSAYPLSRDASSATYRYPNVLHTFDNGFAFIDSTGYTAFDLNVSRITADLPTPSQRRLELGKKALQLHMSDFSRR